MSIHAKFDNPRSVSLANMPIVLRFAGLHPNDLGRFDMHDNRSGGDLSHVDREASALNEQLFGADDWKACLRAEVEDAKQHNLQAHVEALTAKSRKKEARKVLETGPVDPWKRGRHGPLREGILTVNKKWFGGTGCEEWDPERVADFRKAALTFLKQHFPDGQLRYASGHADEEAYHIHFVVVVWRERFTVNRGHQRLLQASMNPLLKDYEHAQTLAGSAFKHLGITRGERRAEARRAAKAADEPVPKKQRHTPPSEWRAEQRELAQADANMIMDTATEKADALVEDGRSLGQTTVRKSRKRAIREAQERREKAEREARVGIAVAARHRDALAREAARMRDAAEAAERDREAAEQESEAAAALLISYAEKVKAQGDMQRVGMDRLLAMKAELAARTDALQTVNIERARAQAACDRALEEVKAAVLEKEKTNAQRQEAESDLKQMQDQIVAQEAAAMAATDQAEQAERRRDAESVLLAAAKKNREEEEVKLTAAKVALYETETRAADMENTVRAVEDGIELIAAEVLREEAMPGQRPTLLWGPAAPQNKEQRQSLLESFWPAHSVIGRIARLVSKAVMSVLAAERQQIARDAAFLAGLHADWEAGQCAKLEELSRAAGTAPSDAGPGS